MRTKPKRGDLVQVMWRDITTVTGGDGKEADLSTATFTSWGIMLSQDEETLMISHDIDMDDKETRGGSCYPAGCLIKVRLVEEGTAKEMLK